LSAELPFTVDPAGMESDHSPSRTQSIVLQLLPAKLERLTVEVTRPGSIDVVPYDVVIERGGHTDNPCRPSGGPTQCLTPVLGGSGGEHCGELHCVHDLMY